MRWTIPLTVIASILLVLPGCGENSSPAGPGDGEVETVSLTFGNTRYGSPRSYPIEYHITGAGIDTTVTHTLDGVPAGTYTVSCLVAAPYRQETTVVPASRTVTAVSGILAVDPFLIISNADKASLEENSLGIIYGRISCIDMVRDAFSIALTTVEDETFGGTSLPGQSSSNYSFKDVPYGTYHVTPALSLFEFDPPTRTLTLDDIFTVANFAATYTGPELHTISARVVSDVQDFSAMMSVTTSNVYIPLNFPSDETGYIVTLPMKPGPYTITIYGRTPHSSSSSDWEHTPQFPVMLSDQDVYLGEITMRYIGPMEYEVSGTVTDTAGNGIEGVTITLLKPHLPGFTDPTARTGDVGNYLFSGALLTTKEDLNITMTASKSGWVFDPPSINLTQAYDGTLSWVEFTADFTGSPVEPVTTP